MVAQSSAKLVVPPRAEPTLYHHSGGIRAPAMFNFGEAVLDVVCLINHVEADLTRPGRVTASRLLDKLDAIVWRNRVAQVRHPSRRMFEGLSHRSPVSLVDKLDGREFARAIDADEQGEPAFGDLNHGYIHVKEADQVALETLSLRLVALDVGPTRYDVWQAAAQR